MHWLFLLSSPECHETATSDFDGLESDSWKITNSVTGSTETSNEDFIVFIDQSHATVLWDVSGDSLVVLLKLDSDTLSDSGVRLLSFNSNLFNDNAGSVRGLSKRLLPFGSRVLLFVSFISPSRRKIS